MVAAGSAVRTLLAAAADRPRTLAFAAPAAAARPALEAVDDAALGAGRPVRDREAVIGLRAALWLLHDFMDEAHALCNRIEDTVGGAYWHAILHRREPDAGNARYWLARVGAHPIFPALLAEARALEGTPAELTAGPSWRPERFVALCAAGGKNPALLALQRREWALLFQHEWARAFS